MHMVAMLEKIMKHRDLVMVDVILFMKMLVDHITILQTVNIIYGKIILIVMSTKML